MANESVLEAAKKCTDMSLIPISEFPWISILGALIENYENAFARKFFWRNDVLLRPIKLPIRIPYSGGADEQMRKGTYLSFNKRFT